MERIRTGYDLIRAVIMLISITLMSACGGGSIGSDASSIHATKVFNPLGQQLAIVAPEAVATDLKRRTRLGVVLATPNAAADQFLNWAEINFPQYFPSHGTTLTEGPWIYRSYMQTGVLLGINAGDVYVTGGEFGGQLFKAGKVSDFVKPAIPVKRSSYENKMMAGEVLGQVRLPDINRGSEQLWAAHALGDFFQDGSLSLVAFSIAFNNPDGAPSTIPGHAFFFKNIDGVWIDKTSSILDDNSGCIGARRLIVADFNGDGKPDVLATCSGFDGAPHHGEKPRMLLSQPDGRYLNKTLPANCFCTDGAAIDLKGRGYSDFILKDNAVSSDLLYYRNNGDGTFNLDQSRVPDSTRMFGPNYSREILTVVMADIWGTGKYDLILAGTDRDDGVCNCGWRTTIFRNNGSDSWKDEYSIVLPSAGEFVDVYDLVVYRGSLYQFRWNYNNEHIIQRVDIASRISTTLFRHGGSYGAPYTIQNLIVHGGKIKSLELLPISVDP